MSSKPASEGRRPWSIALRLTVWYTSAAFALVLVATISLYWALVINLDREDDHYLADKVEEVRRVIEDRPGDQAALLQEVNASGADREGGRFFIRVTERESRNALESPGMSAFLRSELFPPPGQSVEHGTTDGRSFRMRTEASRDGKHLIQVAMNTSHDDELLADYREQLAYVLGFSLLAAAAGGYWIARRGMRPVADVTETARRIRPAHMNERIGTARLPAEVRDLADTFNLMLDRLEDAFARLGRFAADIAHELRTPVNNLRGEVEVALGRPRSVEEYREVLGSCLEECGRLTRLIDSLLFLARAENPKTELVTTAVDVADKLRTVRDFYEPAAAEAGVHLEIESPPGLTLSADRTLLQRALANLVSNALAHTPAGGTVTLFAVADRDLIHLGVRDTGPGISAEHFQYVFDRFFRADPARSSGQGHVGLGLAIVKAIAELHGGSVRAESPTGRGATIALSLPVSEKAGTYLGGT